MPGRSRVYVAQSVPVVAAHASNGPRRSSGGDHTGDSRKLYSKTPARSCSSVRETSKSPLKSLPNEEAHGKVQPIRCL